MSDDVPKLVRVDEVKLFNPQKNKDERIDKIDFEGSDLADHPYIEERLSEGYVMRGFAARVVFDGELFDIAFSGTEMMGYAKVEDIKNREKAQRLMDILREKYLEHFKHL